MTLILEQLLSGFDDALTEAWTFILQCGPHLGEVTLFHYLIVTIKANRNCTHSAHKKSLQEAIKKAFFFSSLIFP